MTLLLMLGLTLVYMHIFLILLKVYHVLLLSI